MQKDYVNGHNCTANVQKEMFSAEYAGFWVRLAAYMIDSVLVFAALLIVRLVFVGIESLIAGTPLGGNILFHYTLKDIVLYGFQILYFVLCTYFTGTTIGKRALSLRVVNADEEEKLTILNVVYRETVGRFLSSIILCVGYIMIGIDKEKRGLHDILCDTRVVYGKRIKVYPVYQGTPTQSAPPIITPAPAQSVSSVQPAPPVQPVPPVPPVSSVQPMPSVQPAPPEPQVPKMPEGSYQFVRPQDVEIENREQQEERDS